MPRQIKKLLKITAAFALVGLICCIPVYIVIFKILPEQDPDNQFNRNTILQVLSGETRVFYNDGTSSLEPFSMQITAYTYHMAIFQQIL